MNGRGPPKVGGMSEAKGAQMADHPDRTMQIIRRTLATFSCVMLAALTAFAQRDYRVLVIRAELGGQPFSVSEEYIDSTLREASRYFNEQCAPELTVSFEPGPLVSLTGTYTNETAHLAVDEACRLANTAVNYRNYDSEGDGMVDCIGVLFSGQEVWPQFHTLSAKSISLRLDRVLIDGYWVGHTDAWIIPGTEDLRPYITAKDKQRKWIIGTAGMAVIAAVLSGIMMLILR